MTSSLLAFPKNRDENKPFDPDPSMYELERLQHVEIWDGTTPWIVRDNDLFRELLADPRISNDVRRDGYPAATAAFKAMRMKKDGLITFDRRDGEEHEKMRRILLRDFSAKRMNELRPRIENHMVELLDDFFAGGQPGDVVGSLSFTFTTRVLSELLGLPHKDLEGFEELVATLVHTAGGDMEKIMAAHAEIRAYVRSLVIKAKTEPTDGAISRLVQDHLLGEVLTEDEIVENTILLFMGGFETSANAISLGTLALLHFRDQWEDLVANADDRRFVMNATEEILRYLTVTQWGRRRVALEDIEIEGVTIKAGEGIIFYDLLANRDPSVFDGDPNRLDLRRDAKKHVAFAAGPHHCPGNQLARMELQTYFSMMAKRAPKLELATPFEDVQFKDGSQVYGLKELLVKW
jgi:cytochrome P450